MVDTHDALRRAREAQLDLVEVAPNADPPVCRIMDYGKWKYQQKKKEQKAKAHAKHSELKEVRLRPGTDDHDLQIKIKQAMGFIEEGHKVQFTVMFKGRQMAHRELGFQLCKQVTEQFATKAHIELAPRMMGKRITMIVVPGVKAQAPAVKPAPKPAVVQPAATATATATAAVAATAAPKPAAVKG